jgi:hypothetical protein
MQLENPYNIEVQNELKERFGLYQIWSMYKEQNV